MYYQKTHELHESNYLLVEVKIGKSFPAPRFHNGIDAPNVPHGSTAALPICQVVVTVMLFVSTPSPPQHVYHNVASESSY